MEEIKSLFGYNLSNDKVNVHPPDLCNRCRRKLDRVRYFKGNVEHVQMVTFDVHTDMCKICVLEKLEQHHFKIIQKSVSPADVTETQKTFSMEDVQYYAIKNGYMDIKNDHGQFKVFTKILHGENNVPVIEKVIKVYLDFSWRLFAFEKQVSCTGSLLSLFDNKLSIF